MSEIVAIVSPKGGSGATFVCSGLWHSFAKSGKKVLAVDLCGKTASLDFALGFQNDSVYNVFDVVNNECNLEEALCFLQTNSDACFLRTSIETVDIEILKTLLLSSSFEYILFDVPNNEEGIEIMSCSNRNIIVTDCTEVSARICDEFASFLDWNKTFLIINKIIPSYIENKIMPTVDEIVDGIGIRPIGLIPWHPDAMALYASTLDTLFSDKNLAKVFDNITARIQGSDIPAIDFNTYYECFKIKKRR